MHRCLSATVFILLLVAQPQSSRADVINCTLDRGNLCFPTRCSNSPKSERLSLDLEANTYRYCPSRYSDDKCVEVPMQFTLRETSIVGVAREGAEIAARSIFLNQNTGSLTTSLLAPGGIAAIDFGTCELPR